MAEFIKFEHRIGNHARAQQAWQILTAYVQFRLVLSKKDVGPSVDLESLGAGVITYGKLGRLMGLPSQTAGQHAIRPVRHIFRFCEANGLPLLSAMVVTKATGLPGWNYRVPDQAALNKIKEEVLNQNWFEIGTPSASLFKKYPLGEIDD